MRARLPASIVVRSSHAHRGRRHRRHEHPLAAAAAAPSAATGYAIGICCHHASVIIQDAIGHIKANVTLLPLRAPTSRLRCRQRQRVGICFSERLIIERSLFAAHPRGIQESRRLELFHLRRDGCSPCSATAAAARHPASRILDASSKAWRQQSRRMAYRRLR